MAAYAALLSLNSIINQLQHHPRPPISMDQCQVQSLTQNITFLQDFLEVYSHVRNKDVDRLQSCIAEAAYAAADVIESHIPDQILARRHEVYQLTISVGIYQAEKILAQSTTHEGRIGSTIDFYQGLQKVIEDMDFIKKEMVKIKEKMGSVQDTQQHGRSSVRASISSGSSSTGRNTVVGFDDVSEEIMDKLTRRESNLQIIPIVGMGGIGKTTLAKTVYENQVIVQHFDIRGWATISQEYSVKEILLEILLQLVSQEYPREKHERMLGEQTLGEMVYKRLYGRRYLIIMDDLWDIEVWDTLKRYFPRDTCGCGIIITSRLSNLAVNIGDANGIKMGFLNEDKSWNLLCKTVFEEDGCLVELEKTGKKIAKKCKGLPLSLVVIGGLLKKSEQTQENWEYIAENLNSVVNLEDNERCLKLLHMSYDYLPVHLKPCFLYMGVLNEDAKISVSELIKLWVAEGFLKPISGKSLEEVAEEYLKALVDRNLILVDRWKRSGKIKLCKMHDLLRDLCLREAKKDKFLYVIRCQSPNEFPPDTSTQRRIVIHGSTSEKGYDLPHIHDALKSAPLARSLICDNLEIASSCNSRLLNILFDRHDENGLEYAPQLLNLRLIDVSFRPGSPKSFREIPSSVPLLWNLQTLVLNGFYFYDDGILFDIWKMPHVRHVDCFQVALTNPGQGDFILENLHTLSSVSNFKCGEEVVKRIPNVKKLKIFYEHTFEGSHYCLSNLGRLHKLKSISCKFYPSTKLSRSDLLPNLTFPHSLKKLTLEGKEGLHWEDISTKIGSLPLLQALTLEGKLFIGTEWETVEGQFPSLKFLTIKYSHELECWTTDNTHFPRLEHLILEEAKKLKEIPLCIGDISTLQRIELTDCTDSIVVSAKKIAEEQEELGNEDLQVRVEIRAESKQLESLASNNFIVEVRPSFWKF